MDHRHCSAAPVVVGTAMGKCPLTVEQLEKHLKQSGYGRDKDHYLCYFMEGKPPRCAACNQQIAFHEDERSSRTQQTMREAWRHEPLASERPSSRGPFGTTPAHAECFLCAERNERRRIEKMKDGDLDITSGSPSLNRVEFDKLVSTTDFLGRTGCAWEAFCCCAWAEKPVERPTCDECGIQAKLTHPLMDEAEKADIDAFWAAHPDLEFRGCEQCNRVVCNDCIREGRHMRPKSRYNPTEPEWWTSLFGCCASPRILCNTMWCYGLLGHESSAFTCDCKKNIMFEQRELRSHVLSLPESHGLWNFMTLTSFIPVAPLVTNILVMTLDPLLCITNRCMRHRDNELRLRFGIQPHSTAEIICCRYCVYMRQFREAEARGFPQPTACTFYSDLPGMWEARVSAVGDGVVQQLQPPTLDEML